MSTNPPGQYLIAAVTGVAFSATNEFLWASFPDYIPTQALVDFIGRVADQSVVYFAIGILLDWIMYAFIAVPFAIVLMRTIQHVRRSVLLVSALAAGIVVIRYYLASPSSVASNPPSWQFGVMMLGICCALPIAYKLLTFVTQRPQRQAPIT